MTTRGLSALFLAALLGACASTDPPLAGAGARATRTAKPDSPRTEAATSPDQIEDSEPPGEPPPEEVAAALDRALAEGWQELRMIVECSTDAGLEIVEIFGSGTAIWSSSSQFQLTHDQMRQLLEAFRETDFAHMKEIYGGRTGTAIELPGAARGSASATKVVCRVGLELDGLVKNAVQLWRGEQFPPLRRLAEEILDTCREPARGGITAADLADGLEKIATGTLAPETLRVLLHRKGEPGTGAEGWLLELTGRRASGRTFREGEGYAPPLRLELDPDDLVALAGRLAEQLPDDLPANLYAEQYTDLKLRVLGRRKSVQARQFADMTPVTHGESQERFDRIFGELKALQERVMAEGRPGPAD